MNRISLSILALLLYAGVTNAQSTGSSIGLRFGAGDGFGTEISYQQGLRSPNRLEFDLGFHNNSNYNRWGLTGLYHWVWKLDQGFNWYAGFGGKIGSWSYDQKYTYSYNNGFLLAAAGDVGVEYTFPSHIQIALDARPEIGLVNHGSGIDVGLAVRYHF